METLDADLLEKLEVDLLEKLKESGRVHSLELLRSDIRNYNNLKAELSRVESEYAMGLLPYREKIDQANAELEKITDDRNLILECVNDLFEARLLDYRYVNEEGQWAFVVIS